MKHTEINLLKLIIDWESLEQMSLTVIDPKEYYKSQNVPKTCEVTLENIPLSKNLNKILRYLLCEWNTTTLISRISYTDYIDKPSELIDDYFDILINSPKLKILSVFTCRYCTKMSTFRLGNHKRNDIVEYIKSQISPSELKLTMDDKVIVCNEDDQFVNYL